MRYISKETKQKVANYSIISWYYWSKFDILIVKSSVYVHNILWNHAKKWINLENWHALHCSSKTGIIVMFFPCFAMNFFVRVIWQSWNICTHCENHIPSIVVIIHMLRVIQWAGKNEIKAIKIGIKMNKSRNIIRQWSEMKLCGD